MTLIRKMLDKVEKEQRQKVQQLSALEERQRCVFCIVLKSCGNWHYILYIFLNFACFFSFSSI